MKVERSRDLIDVHSNSNNTVEHIVQHTGECQGFIVWTVDQLGIV